MLKYLTQIFRGEHFEWNVNLSPKEVLDLLKAKNQGTILSRMLMPGVSVLVISNRFTVAKMSIGDVPLSGNSFVHVLSGKVTETPNGAKVTARFRLHLFVFIFFLIWMSIVPVTVLFLAIFGKNNIDLSVLPIFALPIFGAALAKFGRWLGESNEREIIGVINSCLNEYKISDPSLRG